ncbi:MAG: hypothetical protein DMD85_14135 [Candidatus Rokuibacteriota bacterium]|nr:MAG: hypothetical protein DMD85_14135 [Candidatus Rokubacteria bacterium]
MASALHSPRVARLPRMLSAHWNGSVKPSFACARCAAKAAMTHTRLVAVVILIALALMPWGAPAAGRRDDDRRGAPVKKQEKPQTWRQAKPEDSDDDKGPWINGVSPKVRKHVGSGDRARVLVSLRLPGRGHVPESRLTHAAASLQRSDIALIGGQLMARLRKYNVRLVHRYTYVPLIALEIDAAALAELEGAALWVDRVFDDAIKQPILAESVPLIGADRAWGRGFDGSGTVVAVLDTGVDASHPFLLGKVVEEACYSSTLAKHSTTFCPNGLEEQVGPGAAVPCPLDAQGCFHGTHVAGIAAGDGATAGVTFSGVAPGAQLMAVQVFSKFTSVADCGLFNTPCVGAYTSDLISGLERVYTVRSTRNIASVNLSLGGGSFTAACDAEPEKMIIDTLRSAGVATVVAAGNDGSPTSLSSPACISSAVSVGSTTKSDAVSSFSNVAPFMSLFAPGEDIVSSVTGGGFAMLSGTSMATPHVAGSWAILKQATPASTVDQLLGSLQSTGVPVTDTRSGTPVTRPRIRVDLALDQLVPPTLTVTAVTPDRGKTGTTVTATIDGTGFVSGATVSAGSGITVSSVAVLSPTRMTARFAIASSAALGARNVRVTVPGAVATLTNGFTVLPAVTLDLAYNGKLRDRVGALDTARTPDGALDGTLTLTLSATSARTITALRLQNSIGGVWDTTSPNSAWLLGVAPALDSPLLNNATTMTVNTTLTDGGTLRLFASDYGNGVGFGVGQQLTLIATLSDGTSVQGTTTVTSSSPTVTAVSPNQGQSGSAVAVTIDGSGFANGASVNAGVGITATGVTVLSATRLTATFTIAADASAGARDVTVTNPSGTGGTLANAFTITTPQTVVMSLAYNGKLRDKVGGGDTARGPDGSPDGTLTLSLSAPGGRTVTALLLQNGIGGSWDTTAGNGIWLLGVATSLDGALLNNAATMAVNTLVPDGGSVRLFASDYNGGLGFSAGLTLTVTVSFSDGTSAQATTTTPAPVTVSSVSPSQGTVGSTVPVTIDGNGFASGATVSAGAGITVSNVAFVSSTRLSASFAIDGAAAAGGRDVVVTNPNGGGGSLANAFTVNVAAPVVVSSVSPSQGTAGSTVAVTIDGSGFASGASVSAGAGITVSNVAYVSPARLTASFAIDGAAAAGGRAVVVTNPNGMAGSLSNGFMVNLPTPVTVSSVSPAQGMAGSTVPVTIDGSGFASGATVSAGADITVTNVAFVSSARLTASFAIDSAATAGGRAVVVINPNGIGGSLPSAFTVTVPAPATLALTFNGKLRDRVGGGDTALVGDGAVDATMTLTLSAAGGKTITALQLQNGIGGGWDTTPNISWVLGVASSLDGALLNNAATTAVNMFVPDGGSLRLFASDYNGGQGFAGGLMLTVTATFSDGTSAVATTVTTAGVTVTALTPNQGLLGSTVAVTIDGTGFASNSSVSAGSGITVTNIAFVSSTRLTASFVIDSAASGGARDVTVTTPGNGGGTRLNGFTVNVPTAVTLSYDGKLRDKVGGGDMWLGGDGSLDATMTLRLSAPAGKTITALQLQNGIGGLWDTIAPNSSWLIGVAGSLDGAMLNDPTSMAVTAVVPDGGTLTLFASDYGNGFGFGSGRNLTVTVTFSDGTTATASAVTP